MKKFPYYLLASGIIFVTQVVFFMRAQGSLEGAKLDQKEISQLKHKNAQLELQLSYLEKTRNREIASTGSIATTNDKLKSHVDLSLYYLTQLENFKKQNKTEEALKLIDKIKDQSIDSEILARAHFEKINLVCKEDLDMNCINEIDTIVSQFPESNWAAKGLVKLSQLYYIQNRPNEAKSLLEIIKKDFNSYSDISQDIKGQRRQQL